MTHLVRVASPLRSYTRGAATVEADGTTIAELLADIERRYPGIRFRMIDEQDRIRPHVRLYVETREVEGVGTRLEATETVHIICALTGG